MNLKTTCSVMAATLKTHAEQTTFNVKERVLTCTICLELFNEPKILPCFHTFCKNCLWNHVLNTVKLQHFPCPLCRTDIHLPVGGVDNFQGNFYIREFTELIQQDCSVKGQKRKIKGSRSEVNQNGKVKNETMYTDLYCPSHAYRKEWVVAYCKRCRVPICLQCKMHEHSGHEWDDLAVVVGEAQKQLYSLGTKVKKYQKLLTELSEDRRKYMEGFTSQVSSVSSQIRSCADDIKHKVDSRCESLLLLLDHLKVTEISKVESHKIQLGKCFKGLSEVKEGMEHMLKGSGVLDLLASKTHLQEKAEDTIRGIPDYIERCCVVYDRKNSEGLGQKIESAMGYLSAERDELGDGDHAPTTEPPPNTEPTPQVPGSAPQPNVTTPLPAGIRLVRKSSFKVRPNNAGIRFIVPVPNIGIVVGYDSSPRYVDLIDDEGNKIRKYEAVASTSCALLLGHTNLVLCTSNPRQLSQRRLPQFTPICYRTSDLPVTPTGLAVRNPRELIFCGKEKAGIGTGIYKYNLETKQTSPIYANGDLHILKAPSSVVVTQDGDEEIFVVSDPKRKSVFFFSTEGDLLHTFPSQRCSFCPEGMCRDMEGNIIVADKGNNSVVALSPQGVFLQELTKGVQPRTVTFDGLGRLWMGEAEGTVTIFDYYI